LEEFVRGKQVVGWSTRQISMPEKDRNVFSTGVQGLWRERLTRGKQGNKQTPPTPPPPPKKKNKTKKKKTEDKEKAERNADGGRNGYTFISRYLNKGRRKPTDELLAKRGDWGGRHPIRILVQNNLGRPKHLLGSLAAKVDQSLKNTPNN